jgi:hypothetical protein
MIWQESRLSVKPKLNASWPPRRLLVHPKPTFLLVPLPPHNHLKVVDGAPVNPTASPVVVPGAALVPLPTMTVPLTSVPATTVGDPAAMNVVASLTVQMTVQMTALVIVSKTAQTNALVIVSKTAPMNALVIVSKTAPMNALVIVKMIAPMNALVIVKMIASAATVAAPRVTGILSTETVSVVPTVVSVLSVLNALSVLTATTATSVLTVLVVVLETLLLVAPTPRDVGRLLNTKKILVFSF